MEFVTKSLVFQILIVLVPVTSILAISSSWIFNAKVPRDMSWIENTVDSFESFNITQLLIDQAWINVTSTDRVLYLYEVSKECLKCPYSLKSPVNLQNNGYIFSTIWPSKFRLRTSNIPEKVRQSDHSARFCDLDLTGGEFGVYEIEASGSQQCVLKENLEPVNIYLPLVLALLFFLLFGGIYLLYDHFLKPKLFPKNDKVDKNEGSKKRRMESFDVFRGLSSVWMIFSNTGAGGYYFFAHITWDGLLPIDFVFSWLMWIMGVMIPISIKSRLKRGVPKHKILWEVFVRSIKMVGLGWIENSVWAPVRWEIFRFMGVLPRYAFCYFVCCALVIYLMDFDYEEKLKKCGKFRKMFIDIEVNWRGWIIVLLLIAAHTFITFFMEVPGCPTGYTGPGGGHLFDEIDKYPDPDKCAGGANNYIDVQIMGKKHLFDFPTNIIYKMQERFWFDPEGILGNLTTVLIVWLGVQAGTTMMIFPKFQDHLKRWMGWAAVTGVITAILTHCKETGGWIPINKNIWSLSFITVSASTAFIIQPLLYWICDHKKWWSGSPLQECGKNAILLYMGQWIFYYKLPFHFVYDSFARRHFPRLCVNLWTTCLWIFICIRLHVKKLYWQL